MHSKSLQFACLRKEGSSEGITLDLRGMNLTDDEARLMSARRPNLILEATHGGGHRYLVCVCVRVCVSSSQLLGDGMNL